MGKVSLTGKKTIVSNTFAEIDLSQGSKFDFYIHQIHYNLDPTDYTEAVVDSPLLQFQITSKNESAIVPLSSKCCFRHHDAILDVVVQGVPANQGVAIPVELSGIYEFKTPIRLSAAETLHVGVKSIFAGTFSVRLLVSLVNVAI